MQIPINPGPNHTSFSFNVEEKRQERDTGPCWSRESVSLSCIVLFVSPTDREVTPPAGNLKYAVSQQTQRVSAPGSSRFRSYRVLIWLMGLFSQQTAIPQVSNKAADIDNHFVFARTPWILFRASCRTCGMHGFLNPGASRDRDVQQGGLTLLLPPYLASISP